MQDHLSSSLVRHGLIHKSLDLDYQGIETLLIKPEDWHSIVIILYAYGYNYLGSQCVYNVAPKGLLASVYHLTRLEYDIDQPKEVCASTHFGENQPTLGSSDISPLTTTHSLILQH